MMDRGRMLLPIGAILGGGLALRLVLALVVFPGAGDAGDLGLFSSWAATLARTGPGTFYASAGSANYPPGYLYVLWIVGALGGGVELLKLPAIVADVGIAALLYVAGRRWFSERTGLLAAALYLFVPVTWYDSAIWGQVDAVGALAILAAIVALGEDWSEAAAALAGIAILVKPQDAIALVVVVPVLVRRHLLAVTPRPRPELHGVVAALDRRLGGALGSLGAERGPVRLATSAFAFLVVVLAGLLPFDIARWAPPSLADVPGLAQLAGFAGLAVSDAGQYAVLSANAFNAWSLVGSPSLESLVGTGGSFTSDSLPVLGGIAASTVGPSLLVGVGFLIVIGLLRRDDRRALLLAVALAAFAFYALPTRVHERYLVPFFAPAALLAALALPQALSYIGAAVLNAANLHVVLAGHGAGGFGGGGPGGLGGLPGGGGPGGFGQVPAGSTLGIRPISLPFPDLLANSTAVTVIAVGQTVAFVGLLVAWLVFVLKPRSAQRDTDWVGDRRGPDGGSRVPRPAWTGVP